jgi:lipoic acid synthetase
MLSIQTLKLELLFFIIMKPKIELPNNSNYFELFKIIKENNLNTICVEGNCPNRGECFSKGTATFLILGNVCTRNCLYCNVKSGEPGKVDGKEAKRIAEAVSKLKLKYVVITSVTRDDLKDGGAVTFKNTIKQIRKLNPDVKIEILTPDFREEIRRLLGVGVDVFGHNLETVKRLFPKLRPKGDYIKSLVFLKQIKEYDPKQITKSGLMVGLGETKEEIFETLNDLKKAKVDIVTIGQYLQPRKDLIEVEKYYSEDEFKEFEEKGKELGFKILAGALVRSSYHAQDLTT